MKRGIVINKIVRYLVLNNLSTTLTPCQEYITNPRVLYSTMAQQQTKILLSLIWQILYTHWKLSTNDE